MLKVFFGTDVERVRVEAFSLVHKETENGALLARFSANEYNDEMVTDIAGGSSLFGTAQVCVIDTPKEDEAVFSRVLEKADLFVASSHTFIIIEKSLTAPEKKLFEKMGAEVTEFTKDTEKKFNTFSLTDALCARDKKSLWILLQKAWKAGVSNEEIIGVLFWQMKTMVLVSRALHLEETGLKPFVYAKTKRALSRFSHEECTQFLYDLLSIYHDGHLGKHDSALALEAWVLKL